LGEFPDNRSPSVQTLKVCAANYFVMDVEVLPVLSITGLSLTSRVNPFTGNRQILTGDVLALLKKRLPADSFCLLAITMEDLYPHPSWNFVFGQAYLRERVGLFSFARFASASSWVFTERSVSIKKPDGWKTG
jgi:archaemetzincin